MDSWNRWASWVTMPTAAPRLSRVRSRTSWPSMRTDPDVTSYSRGTRCDSVVLPAPDGPTSAVMVPGSAVNDTPRSTGAVGSPVPDPSGRGASRLGMDTADAAGYWNHTSSTSTRPRGATKGTASGDSVMAWGASSSSKQRSNDTMAVSRSTRALAR